MQKWNLIVDVALCHNCNNCALAVRDEYVGNAFPGYSRPQGAQDEPVLHPNRRVPVDVHVVTVYPDEVLGDPSSVLCWPVPPTPELPAEINVRPKGING